MQGNFFYGLLSLLRDYYYFVARLVGIGLASAYATGGFYFKKVPQPQHLLTKISPP